MSKAKKTLEQRASEMADYAMEIMAKLPPEEREKRIRAMCVAAGCRCFEVLKVDGRLLRCLKKFDHSGGHAV